MGDFPITMQLRGELKHKNIEFPIEISRYINLKKEWVQNLTRDVNFKVTFEDMEKYLQIQTEGKKFIPLDDCKKMLAIYLELN